MSDSEEYAFSGEEDEVEMGEDEVEEEAEEQSDDDESIRNDLAQTTFEDLLAMRDKLGTKVYRDSVLKKLSGSGAAGGEQPTSNNKDKQASRQASKPKSAKSISAPKPKSQPIVANSKRLETKHNFAILPVPSLATKAKTFRDPRFESTSGTFQADKFEDNYRFLSSMKKRELEVLQKRLKRTKSPEEKAKLTRSMNILRAQLRAETQKDKAREVEKSVKTVIAKDLAPLHSAPRSPFPPPPPPSSSADSKLSPQKPKAPQKPKVFVNKAVVKRAQLVAKFKDLKKRGRLDKYIERKRKKNAGKERKYFEQRI